MLLVCVQVARDALEVRCSELKEWGSSYKKRGEEADEQLNKADMAIEKLTVSFDSPKPSASSVCTWGLLIKHAISSFLLKIRLFLPC